ncbi:MAG: cell division protein FtsQ/DivIB, partial [Alphaproteobacteria bacterium]|nr:cell division protein FtsQ/DivIB [Alphaproteobacteria bacterium]
SVTRRLPQVIVVRITERRPVALWQHQGKLALIDRAGTPIVPAELVRFAHLPIIVGATAARHAGVVLDMLGTEPALYARVVAAVRVADRRWDVRLDNGVVVRLPADRLLTAWRYLAEIERDDHILQRDIAVVDLRLPDRLTVRLTPAAAIRMRDPGQSA